MKQFLMLGLAAVGAYAVYQWYLRRVPVTTAGQNAQPGGQPSPIDFNLFWPSGAGAGPDGGLVSGVPAFNAIPIEAGHGDQQAAARHDNPASTMSGPYEIPFGSLANQGGAMVW